MAKELSHRSLGGEGGVWPTEQVSEAKRQSCLVLESRRGEGQERGSVAFVHREPGASVSCLVGVLFLKVGFLIFNSCAVRVNAS